MDNEKTTAVKAYSQKEIIALYGVSRKIFIKWLAPFTNDVGTLVGKIYTPKQVRIIFQKLDPPQ
jgi:transposase